MEHHRLHGHILRNLINCMGTKASTRPAVIIDTGKEDMIEALSIVHTTKIANQYC